MSKMLNMPNEVLSDDVKKVLDEMAQDYADRLLSDKPEMIAAISLGGRFVLGINRVNGKES